MLTGTPSRISLLVTDSVATLLSYTLEESSSAHMFHSPSCPVASHSSSCKYHQLRVKAADSRPQDNTGPGDIVSDSCSHAYTCHAGSATPPHLQTRAGAGAKDEQPSFKVLRRKLNRIEHGLTAGHTPLVRGCPL